MLETQAGSPCEAHSVPPVGGQFPWRPGPGQNVLRQRTGSGEQLKPDSWVSARGLGLGWKQNRDLELKKLQLGWVCNFEQKESPFKTSFF